MPLPKARQQGLYLHGGDAGREEGIFNEYFTFRLGHIKLNLYLKQEIFVGQLYFETQLGLVVKNAILGLPDGNRSCDPGDLQQQSATDFKKS